MSSSAHSALASLTATYTDSEDEDEMTNNRGGDAAEEDSSSQQTSSLLKVVQHIIGSYICTHT
jgi:hypothetical protein